MHLEMTPSWSGKWAPTLAMALPYLWSVLQPYAQSGSGATYQVR